VIALAIGIMLNALGTAIGATMVDATSRDTPDASSFGIGAGLWFVISNLIALAIGSYAAARLSGTSDGTDGTLHGLAVWGASFLVSAVLLGNVVSGIASTAVTGASSMIGGLAQGTGSVLSTAGQEVADRTSTSGAQSAAQSMIDRAQNALNGGGEPSAMTSDQRKAEMGTLMSRRVTDGPLPEGDRARLNALVAAEYNLSPEDAQARVQQVEQQTQQTIDQAEEKARNAADAAASSASAAAFAVFLTMLLGMGAAVLGSRRGTRHVVAVARNTRSVS
jgi:hypothetical protein